MSSKFNKVHPAYVKPAVCRPPPPVPLPPYFPTPLYVQAEGRLRWPLPGGGVEDWTRSARDIPRVSPTYYYKEVACGPDVLVFEITINWTLKKIQGGLTAYTNWVYQASTSWSPVPLPADAFWRVALEFGDFHIPLGATAWLKIWV